MAYLKPQTPLKDLNSGDYFYPLTTIDQILLQDNSTRLSAILNKADFTTNRAIYFNGTKLLSSGNIFLNNDSIAINKTSILSGYKFEVNGKVCFHVNDYKYWDYSEDNPIQSKRITSHNSNSYRHWIILLLPYQTTTNQSIHNYIYGNLHFKKSGGNVYDEVFISANLCYNQLKYKLTNYGDGSFTPISCTYNGIKYFALKCYDHDNPWTQIYFDGYLVSDYPGGTNTLNLPYMVNYKGDGTEAGKQTVVNTEVNNSISTTLTDSIITSVIRYDANTKNGTANRIAYYSANNIISSGSITTDGGYLGNISYLSINNAHQTNHRLYVNGDGYFNELFISTNTGFNDVNFSGKPGTYIGNGCIELNFSTPYIDFHYNNSATDYTSRIIEDAAGQLYITGKLKVGTSRNGYALNAASFICDSWVRTVGNTGWYNESYGGGWYMGDTTWVRSYNSKSVYTGGGTLRSDFDVWGNRVRLCDNWIGFYQSTGGGNRYGFIQTDNSRMYFRKENGDSNSAGATFDFNGPIYTNGNGIYAQHGHIMTVAGNEVNFIPDGYNSIFWFNYETFNRKGNGNISEYIMANGRHGYANLRANKVYNAVWNDFAEYREGDITEPGRVVAATQQSNKVTKTTIRLQPCAHIISDTFGCSVGQSDTAKTPVGVAGRVLVYPYQDISNYKIGDCLCAAPNGTADIMSREEIISYPDRIIGIVDEIPTYEYWNQTLTTNKEGDAEFKIQTKIKVDGRIWVYVR